MPQLQMPAHAERIRSMKISLKLSPFQGFQGLFFQMLSFHFSGAHLDFSSNRDFSKVQGNAEELIDLSFFDRILLALFYSAHTLGLVSHDGQLTHHIDVSIWLAGTILCMLTVNHRGKFYDNFDRLRTNI